MNHEIKIIRRFEIEADTPIPERKLKNCFDRWEIEVDGIRSNVILFGRGPDPGKTRVVRFSDRNISRMEERKEIRDKVEDMIDDIYTDKKLHAYTTEPQRARIPSQHANR